jgi:hypothetical protein
MLKRIVPFSLLFTIMAIVYSCSKGGSTGGSGGTGGGGTLDCSLVSNKSFSADVNPIIQSTCVISGCHNAGSGNGPGELLNYNEISSNKAAIRSAVSTGIMPKTGSLTTSQKNSILCWVDSGGLNN